MDYDVLPALDVERRDVEERLGAAEAQREEATKPLFRRLGKLRTAISEGRLVRHELECSCEHPDALADLDALRVELQDANNNRRAMLEAESRRLREAAESDRDEGGWVKLRGDAEQLRKRADERDAQAAAMEEELVGLRKRIAELDARDAVNSRADAGDVGAWCVVLWPLESEASHRPWRARRLMGWQ